ELPVGDVVEQGGEFDDEQVGSFAAGNVQGHAANAVGVPPVVTGGVAGEVLAHFRGGVLEDFRVGHADWRFTTRGLDRRTGGSLPSCAFSDAGRECRRSIAEIQGAGG